RKDGGGGVPDSESGRDVDQSALVVSVSFAFVFRRLRGVMSVQTSSTYARHSCFVPGSRTARHPAGIALFASHSEYCSSWLTSTMYCRVSSSSSQGISASPFPWR